MTESCESPFYVAIEEEPIARRAGTMEQSKVRTDTVCAFYPSRWLKSHKTPADRDDANEHTGVVRQGHDGDTPRPRRAERAARPSLGVDPQSAPPVCSAMRERSSTSHLPAPPTRKSRSRQDALATQRTFVDLWWTENELKKRRKFESGWAQDTDGAL
ncbi:unnamed protein product [Lampetra fluviatilis]